MTDRTFPVLLEYRQRRSWRRHGINYPTSVPWDFIAEHRQQCLRNHDQTPERLAERGGLGLAEMLCVVRDQSFWDVRGTPLDPFTQGADEHALPELLKHLRNWESGRTKP